MDISVLNGIYPKYTWLMYSNILDIYQYIGYITTYQIYTDTSVVVYDELQYFGFISSPLLMAALTQQHMSKGTYGTCDIYGTCAIIWNIIAHMAHYGT